MQHGYGFLQVAGNPLREHDDFIEVGYLSVSDL